MSPQGSEPVLAYTSWCDISEIARGAGFRCPCLVSAELHAQLNDQTLYNALWTACFTLSLDTTDCALFTLDVDDKPVRFKVLKTNRAAYLGRVEDF